MRIVNTIIILNDKHLDYKKDEPSILLVDMYGTDIYEDDTYYDFNGDIVSDANLSKYIREYEVE